MNVMFFPIDDMLLPLRGESCESSQFPRTMSVVTRISRGRCPRLLVFPVDVAHGYSYFPWTLPTADGFMPFQGVEDTHAPQGQHRLTHGNVMG